MPEQSSKYNQNLYVGTQQSVNDLEWIQRREEECRTAVALQTPRTWC